jgi:hypothetical protein
VLGRTRRRRALSRQGRYRTVRDNLQVKEVRLGAGLADDRFIVCYNPVEADHDAELRAHQLAALKEMIDDTDQLSPTKRAELVGVSFTKPHLKRYLRTTPSGLLRIDAAAIAREANLDGKYLLSTSDPTLSAEDLALGYKQLLEVERGWRELKTTPDLRPVYHRREDRIRSHILLCWLALLLIRIAETRTGQTWPALHRELQCRHLGTFTGPAGDLRPPYRTHRRLIENPHRPQHPHPRADRRSHPATPQLAATPPRSDTPATGPADV